MCLMALPLQTAILPVTGAGFAVTVREQQFSTVLLQATTPKAKAVA